jgi:ribosomal protein S18 acetylase RimI-like enzyme
MIRRATPEDAAAVARVHIESWRSTYRGLVPEEVLERLDLKERTALWQGILEAHDPQATFVATDAEKTIVGFINGGPERAHDPVYTGEVYALYLLESQQKLGYGRGLFLTLARELQEQGHTAMLLWVLVSNPARRFYEAMGGQVLRTKPLEIGDVTLEETAYGYRDLAVLSKYSSARA